jgi:Putative peptidoglycan binding domain
MSTKSILSSVVVGALSLIASVALAVSHGGGGSSGSGVTGGNARGGGSRAGFAPGRFGPGFAGSRAAFSRNFRDGRFHHRGFNDFVFFGGFGDPFFNGFYPYGYYPYGYYPYGYYPYGYDPAGYGYGDPRGQPGYASSASSVVTMQRSLARSGYYHGRIDGVMGPKTREAMRAFQRSRNSQVSQM